MRGDWSLALNPALAPNLLPGLTPHLALSLEAAAAPGEIHQSGGGPVAHLLIRKGTNPGHRLGLDKDTVILGRSPDCDIPIPSPSISRQHARLLRVRSEERRVGKECRSRWSPYH